MQFIPLSEASTAIASPSKVPKSPDDTLELRIVVLDSKNRPSLKF